MNNLWVQVILLAAPLLLVPLAVWHDVSPERRPAIPRIITAALALLVAKALTPGILAGLLALPWLITCLYLLQSFYFQWNSRRALKLHLFQLFALSYLCIGAMWALADRFGWQPLDFDPLIVLLTAVHFHYAGFALSWIAGKIRSSHAPRLYSSLFYLALAGVPGVAIGITASQLGYPPIIEMISVGIMALGGLVVGIACIRRSLLKNYGITVRLCWGLAGTSLCLGMVLAVLYGLRYVWPIPWLSIPWMYAVHGTLNSVGFALPALLGHYLERRYHPST